MLIKVKVFPGTKKERFVKKSKDSFEIKVKAEAEHGAANKEVLRILTENLKIPKAKIRLIKGAKQRNKIFEIRD